LLRQAQQVPKVQQVHRAPPDHRGPQDLRATVVLRVPLVLKGRLAPRELKEVLGPKVRKVRLEHKAL